MTIKPRFHALAAREKVRAFQLVKRLQQNALGQLKPELTMGQIRSIEILLRKCLPDLLQAENVQTLLHRFVVEIPKTLGKEEWLEKYGPRTVEGEIVDLPKLADMRHPQ
jgi:hypothetical protein